MRDLVSEAHEGSQVTADYNDIWSNGDDYLHAFLIGDHDLSVDPFFADQSRGDFRLLEGSPCIDVGDPRPIFNDLDDTRNDLGALGGPFGGVTTSIDKISTNNVKSNLTIIPNPLRTQARISFHVSKTDRVHLSLYDLSGKVVGILIDEEKLLGEHALLWSNETGPKGNLFTYSTSVIRSRDFEDGIIVNDCQSVSVLIADCLASLQSARNDGALGGRITMTV